MRKVITKYVVYRVDIDNCGRRELVKPGGNNMFWSRQDAMDAIKKNTNAGDGKDYKWYEDFPYVIEEELIVVYMRPKK